MDFAGFTNNDFDFFKKKSTMDRPEYNEKKEQVKRHFREFCYQLQKCYHSNTGGTLILDKNFQGLNKSKNYITAKSKVGGLDFMELSIDLCQDSISINLVSPTNGDNEKFNRFKDSLINQKDVYTKFFKENKQAFIVLYSIDYKKSSEGLWTEEFKFLNKELISGDFQYLINNIEKLQTPSNGVKRSAGVHIQIKISKPDAIRSGKVLPSRVCTEVIRLQNLCDMLNHK